MVDFAHPDAVEAEKCDTHGETLHVNDRCVLCAADDNSVSDRMEMAYHIEKAKRGDQSSRKRVLAWTTTKDEQAD